MGNDIENVFEIFLDNFKNNAAWAPGLRGRRDRLGIVERGRDV